MKGVKKVYSIGQILKRAQELGFCDAVFVSARKFEPIPGLIADPKEKVEQAASLLVLFADYAPAVKQNRKTITLSSYYPVSNRAYHQAKVLERELREQGVDARLEPALPLRQAALRAGGEIGENGMYYHPQYGSGVVIQAMITDIEVEPSNPVVTQRCTKCRACVRACPTGAIAGGDRELCMRNHMKQEIIPDRYKEEIYQLLGCEKCQTVCPLNKTDNRAPIEYELMSVLKGETIKEIQELVGKNMAPKMRVLRQAICYAANQNAREAIPIIRELKQEKLLSETAEWALIKLDADK